MFASRGLNIPNKGGTRITKLRTLVTGIAVTVMAIGLLPRATAEASYPGPNGLISFRAMVGDHSQIFTIDPASLTQVQLTHFTDGDAASAAHWSPDMGMLTFEFDPSNPTSNDFCHVAMMTANGDNLTVLPLANGNQCEATPTFSADGTRIIYEGYNGKHRDALYSMNLDGSDRRLLTACQGRGVAAPEASPDGKMLAFTCGSATGQALFVSSVTGSQLRQLTPYAMQVGVHEDWSPDSRRIMFGAFPNEGTPDAQANAATINADGTGLFWVTNYPAGGLRAYGNSYSPDGRWIVLRIEDGSLNALFKIQSDGTNLTQITPYSTFRPRGMVWGSECPCTP